MPQLVGLVITDGLHRQQLAHIVQILRAGSHYRHACARQGDLGGRGELKHTVRMTGSGAHAQHIREGDKVAVKLVDTVSVIPHQQKIGCGRFHGGDAADGLITVNDAVGVGILGNAPHALDRRVLDQLLHHVHIRAGGQHGDGDHGHAEGLGDLEVPVIAGCGAQPLHFVQLAPRLLAVQQAVGIGLSNGVVHQLQAGIAADKHVFGLRAQNVGKQLLHGG